jgi:hypothetical protein
MIEAAYYPLITDLVSQKGRVLPVSDIWDDIVGGKILGYFDAQRKPKEYQTDDYGTIYRNTFTNVICDKFGAVKKHREKGTVLVFDLDKLQKIGKSYDIEANIQLKLLEDDSPDGPDGSDGFSKEVTTLKENHNTEVTKNGSNSLNISEENPTNNVNNVMKENENPSVIPIKPSGSSEPSVIDVGKSNDKNDNGQNTTTESIKGFKCSTVINSDDMERITHIDEEHPGKLHYPTPEDFENRLDQ